MALVVKDRVQETATTTGTGTFTLSGAVSGFQSFSAIGNGNTTYYTITDGTNWEVGIGTYTSSGTTLSRDTVLKSSNSNNLVNFGAGSKFVFCTYPADKSVYADASNKVSGYAIENTTIGATTATTGSFTSVTTPSVTATTLDLALNSVSTGSVNFSSANGQLFKISDGGAYGGYWNAFSASGSPSLRAIGNVSGAIDTNSAVPIQFRTNIGTSGAEQFRVGHTASAVNYVQVTGAATGGLPTISAQGSDASVALAIQSKSTSPLILQNGSAQRILRADGTGTGVNYFNIISSAASQAPIFSIAAASSDTNVSMAFQPKGTGAIDLAAGSSGVNISNGGTVTAITRTVQGSNYTSVPSLAISAPTTAGGVQATATANLGVLSATIVSGGTGYTAGDTLTVVGGTGTAAQLTVSTVSSGVITAVTVATQNGVYSVFPTNNVSVTGGTGSSATFTISGGILSTFTITAAGSGYIEQPTITFSGGGGSSAAAYASVGALPIIRSLHTEMQFATAGGIGFEVQTYGAGTTTSRFATFASASGNPVVLEPRGAAGNIASVFSSKGTSAIQFYTNSFTLGTGAQQLAVTHTASAVNYVQVTGGATGSGPTISAQGSDGNAFLVITSKGTSAIRLQTGGSSQVLINNTTSAINQLGLSGSTAGQACSIITQGTDTDISMLLVPKGLGIVYTNQQTPVAVDATNTLTIANLLTQIVTTTSATAVSLTLPTGTLTDAGISGGTSAVNTSFEWSIINLGSAVGAITLVAGTAHTIVGSTAIAVGASARLKTRKTATNTFITYRIA